MKNAFLAIILGLTFLVAFPYMRDGNVFSGIAAIFLGGLAMFGVMIHKGKEREPHSGSL